MRKTHSAPGCLQRAPPVSSLRGRATGVRRPSGGDRGSDLHGGGVSRRRAFEGRVESQLLFSSSVLSRGEERAFLRGEESGSERASRERERERERERDRDRSEKRKRKRKRERISSQQTRKMLRLLVFFLFFTIFFLVEALKKRKGKAKQVVNQKVPSRRDASVALLVVRARLSAAAKGAGAGSVARGGEEEPSPSPSSPSSPPSSSSSSRPLPRGARPSPCRCTSLSRRSPTRSPAYFFRHTEPSPATLSSLPILASSAAVAPIAPS